MKPKMEGVFKKDPDSVMRRKEAMDELAAALKRYNNAMDEWTAAFYEVETVKARTLTVLMSELDTVDNQVPNISIKA